MGSRRKSSFRRNDEGNDFCQKFDRHSALAFNPHDCGNRLLGGWGRKKLPEKAKGKPPVAVEADQSPAQPMCSKGSRSSGRWPPNSEQTCARNTRGLVTEVFVTEWVKVKKGDPLAKLDTRETRGGPEEGAGRQWTGGQGAGECRLQLEATGPKTGPTGNTKGR